MSRLLPLLLALTVLAQPAFAIDIPDPASLPEKKLNGDSDPTYPAECARRLLAGKAFLDSGDLEKAQAEFAAATKADESEPWVYFYRAVVAYRLADYPEALRLANSGIGGVNDVFAYGDPTDETKAQLARFTELRDAIQVKLDATGGRAGENPLKKKQEFADALKEGDDAYAKGLLAKAAAAYAKAFRADPTQGEIGLRAATLYADRLKNLLEAARLWQQVLAAGEPHATAARAELQSHRDALDKLLRSELAELHNWIVGLVLYVNGVRTNKDPAEALRLAEAFPESVELQVELALLYAGNDNIEETVAHLQSAARLGLSADDFLARKEFIQSFTRISLDSAKGRPLAEFVRDAYGDDTLGKIRTELKRRADEVARQTEETKRRAREQVEKERKARLAAELKELSAWREEQRNKTIAEANDLLSARSEIEVGYVDAKTGKKRSSNLNKVKFGTSFYRTPEGYELRGGLKTLYYRKNGLLDNIVGFVETNKIPSFARFREATIRTSHWWSEIYSTNQWLPEAGYRPLCNTIILQFGAGILQRSVTRQVDDDFTQEPDLVNQSSIELALLLAPEELPRLQQAFARLAELDAVGNDLEKLRQLRAN